VSTKSIEQKVKAFEDIHDIVNVMKAYAGLNIRKSEEYAPNVRLYQKNVSYAMAYLFSHFPSIAMPERHAGKRVLVAFGSEQGLCGAYNERIADYMDTVVNSEDYIFVIGKRLKSAIEQHKFRITAFMESAVSFDGIREVMETSLSKIMDIYSRKDIYNLTVLFTSVIKNNAEIAMEQILPPDMEALETIEPLSKKPLMYLNPEQILKKLIEERLYISIYKCYVESLRSENWYRLRRMESASENIIKNISDLTTVQRYVRQEDITQEILEILGGSRLV
jgi:F-type H+-transporting ATPase subunit gamma